MSLLPGKKNGDLLNSIFVRSTCWDAIRWDLLCLLDLAAKATRSKLERGPFLHFVVEILFARIYCLLSYTIRQNLLLITITLLLLLLYSCFASDMLHVFFLPKNV